MPKTTMKTIASIIDLVYTSPPQLFTLDQISGRVSAPPYTLRHHLNELVFEGLLSRCRIAQTWFYGSHDSIFSHEKNMEIINKSYAAKRAYEFMYYSIAESKDGLTNKQIYALFCSDKNYMEGESLHWHCNKKVKHTIRYLERMVDKGVLSVTDDKEPVYHILF